MTSPLLLLASTSSSRRTILTQTGFEFVTLSPEVDERAAVAAARDAGENVTPGREAQLLGSAKARAAAARPDAAGHLVLGCDSVFELGGVAYGKPHTPEVAVERWKGMRGQRGTLHTGHHLIDTRSGREAQALVSTELWFSNVSDEEIEAYVATGEPLPCAGGFTVDGRAAAFVDLIEGDFHAVVGLSVSALRSLCQEVGVPIITLWRN